MLNNKYYILDERGNLIASDMDLDTVLLLAKALFEKYYADTGFRLSISAMSNDTISD